MGYALVIAAGMLQGAFLLPMNGTRKWVWENTWFVYSLTGFFAWPWLFLLLTVPHPMAVLATTSMRSLIIVEALGIGWGIGAITFGLGASRMGMALGFTIIIGLAATAGSFIPMAVLAPEKLHQPQGLLTMASLALVLVGLGLSAWGGKLREPKQPGGSAGGSFAVGMAICIVSGFLSACSNLGFTFGSEFIRSAIRLGAPENTAGNAVWAPLTLPLLLFNAGYCVWLMRKNKTGGLLLSPGTGYYWLLAALMGFMWFGGFVLYGPATRRLGVLGTSVGWTVLMSSMVITANILGFATGEWKGANRKAFSLAVAGVAVLIAAICVVGYANHVG